jgi:hypothetical protein
VTRKTVAINVGRGENGAAGRSDPSQVPAWTPPKAAASGQTNPRRSPRSSHTGLLAATTPSPTWKPNPGRAHRRLRMPLTGTDQMRQAIAVTCAPAQTTSQQEPAAKLPGCEATGP